MSCLAFLEKQCFGRFLLFAKDEIFFHEHDTNSNSDSERPKDHLISVQDAPFKVILYDLSRCHREFFCMNKLSKQTVEII